MENAVYRRIHSGVKHSNEAVICFPKLVRVGKRSSSENWHQRPSSAGILGVRMILRIPSCQKRHWIGPIVLARGSRER